MALYPWATERCSEEAQIHGLGPSLDRLKDQILTNQRLVGFDYLFPTQFVKKGLGRSFRLICYRVPLQDDEMIVFLRVLAKGGGEYASFLANWEKNTEEVVRKFQVPDDHDLRQIHAGLIENEPVPTPPEPSETELEWLYCVFQEKGAPVDDLVVLETKEWVQKMRASTMRDFLGLYHQLLDQIDPSSLTPSKDNTDYHEHWHQSVGFSYVFRPESNRLLLLEPLRKPGGTPDFRETLIAKLSEVKDNPIHLTRIAARSYPYLMVLEQEAWLAIQKDEEANLALSAEEAELLDSIRGSRSYRELGYPLFINGRAGSGKSTMLQYLAWDYVDFSLRHNTEIFPIYLTCSRELLERARQVVRSLLTRHYEAQLRGVPDEQAVDDILNRSFLVFHDYLYSLLSPETQERFSHKKFVSYAQFRRLWETDFSRRPEARQVTMDLAWHTIRSYIKGIRSTLNDELGPEEFAALPRKRRSVSLHAYNLVYENVWERWYKRLCQEEGYWDDQDLAAAVLEEGRIQSEIYGSVLCDEAQDFTPIEIELIFQLSVFSGRSLKPEELRLVPFIFAGDPLQTVNPTGFRWDAVQADFYDRFCAALDPRRRALVEINYRELKSNYRSNPGIVNFCNLIQLLRSVVIGVSGMQPQEGWWVDAPISATWLSLDDARAIEQLREHPELVKIVNCDEGEETDFAKRDAILKVLDEAREGVYQNVLGPMRAKGLEFPSVVLYRFGEHVPEGFNELLDGSLDLGENPEARLPFEYFLNRLYVAASRAKGEIVVIDSPQAMKSFWRFASDPDSIDSLLRRVANPGVWRGKIAGLVEWTEWTGERPDPREQARERESQGARKQDPYLLRQAASLYGNLGEEVRAGKCRAKAYELEGNLIEAGRVYQQCGFYDEAFYCYWQHGDFKSVCQLAASVPALASRLRSRAADFASNSEGVNEAFLSMVLRASGDDSWLREVSGDATWRQVLGKLLERLTRTKANVVRSWAPIHRMFETLARLGVAMHESKRALVAFRAKDYGTAASLWEASGQTDQEEYRRCKAALEPFPRKLAWLGKLKDYKQIILEWDTHQGQNRTIPKMDRDSAIALVDAAVAEARLSLAVNVLGLHSDRKSLMSILELAVNKRDLEVADDGAAILARLLVQTKAWNEAVRAAEDGDFSDLGEERSKQLKNLLEPIGGLTRVFDTIVREIAISDSLSNENPEKQSVVSEFLYRHFLGKTQSKTRRDTLSVQVVGAAIERAGKMVNALQYYESLFRNTSVPKGTRDYAAERYVRNLEKYAEYLRSSGDVVQAEEREDRARKVRAEFQMENSEIPLFPRISQKREEQTQPTEWDRGQYKMKLIRNGSRLRISHKELDESVTVMGPERQLRGDAAFATTPSSGGEMPVWTINDWGLTVRLSEASGSFSVTIDFDDGPFNVRLRDST